MNPFFLLWRWPSWMVFGNVKRLIVMINKSTQYFWDVVPITLKRGRLPLFIVHIPIYVIIVKFFFSLEELELRPLNQKTEPTSYTRMPKKIGTTLRKKLNHPLLKLKRISKIWLWKTKCSRNIWEKFLGMKKIRVYLVSSCCKI